MTLTMDPSTSSGNAQERPASPGVPGEQLTGLGAALRHALDGQLAEERAIARATFPAEHLHREPGQSVEQAREWVLDRATYDLARVAPSMVECIIAGIVAHPPRHVERVRPHVRPRAATGV